MKLWDYYDEKARPDTTFKFEITDHKAVSKERPRAARAGHHYTPQRTRKFEKLVADWAGTVQRPPFTCPVEVLVVIHEPIPKSYKGKRRLAAELNLIAPPVGDLDNKLKAITDALNGVAYIDDRQIKKIDAERRYGERHLITVIINRAGLSNQELAEFDSEHNGGSATVG